MCSRASCDWCGRRALPIDHMHTQYRASPDIDISSIMECSQPPTCCSGNSSSSTGLVSNQDNVSDEQTTEIKSYKKARANTLKEKRRMRNHRKKKMKRLRKRPLHSTSVTDLRKALEDEREKNGQFVHKIQLYRGMSRTYWERWRWELEKRKEAMIECKKNKIYGLSQQLKSDCVLQEIDPSMLVEVNLQGTSESESPYIGCGCFSVVKIQKYRGILVAVKEYLPRTLPVDVMHEARMLVHLCHPYVPCFLGICLSQQPLRLVMQFEGILVHAVPKVLTLEDLLRGIINPSPISSIPDWILICVQIMEAVCYLHESAGVLHNDIKADNVLVTRAATCSDYHIVLVDFGKATTLRCKCR